jgi:hypothetical protein
MAKGNGQNGNHARQAEMQPDVKQNIVPQEWLQERLHAATEIVLNARHNAYKTISHSSEFFSTSKYKKMINRGFEAFDKMIPGDANDKSSIAYAVANAQDIRSQSERDKLRSRVNTVVQNALKDLRAIRPHVPSIRQISLAIQTAIHEACSDINLQFELPMQTPAPLAAAIEEIAPAVAEAKGSNTLVHYPKPIEEETASPKADPAPTEPDEIDGKEKVEEAGKQPYVELPLPLRVSITPVPQTLVNVLQAKTLPPTTYPKGDPWAEQRWTDNEPWPQPKIAEGPNVKNDVEEAPAENEFAEKIQHQLHAFMETVFRDDFLKQLAKLEKIYAFSESLSESRSHRLGKLYETHLLNTVNGILRKKELNAAEKNAVFENLLYSLLQSFQELRKELIGRERGDEHTKDPAILSKAMLKCFREHCVESLIGYLELSQSGPGLEKMLAGCEMNSPSKKKSSSREEPSFENLKKGQAMVIEALMPERCKGMDVPFSACERSMVIETIAQWGPETPINSARRKLIAEMLRKNCTGGVNVRSDDFMRTSIESLQAEIRNARTARKPLSIHVGAKMPLPSRAPLIAAPAAQKPVIQAPQSAADEASALEKFLAGNTITGHEISILQAQERQGLVPGVGRKEDRKKYCERLAMKINEECWGSTKENPILERGWTFIDQVLRAIRLKLIKDEGQPAEQVEETVEIAGEETVDTDAGMMTEEIVAEPAISSEAADPMAEVITTVQADAPMAEAPEIPAPLEAANKAAAASAGTIDTSIDIMEEGNPWMALRERMRKEILKHAHGTYPSLEQAMDLRTKLNELDSAAGSIEEKLADFSEDFEEVLRSIPHIHSILKQTSLEDKYEQVLEGLGSVVVNVDEFIDMLRSFLVKAIDLHGEMEPFRAQRNAVESIYDGIHSKRKKAHEFINRNLLPGLFVENIADAQRIIGRMFANENEILRIFEEVPPEIRSIMHDCKMHYESLEEGVLQQISESDSLAKRISETNDILMILNAPKQPRKSDGATSSEESPREIIHQVIRRLPIDNITPVEQAAPRNGEHVVTMRMKKARMEVETPLSEMQVKLLHLLTTFPPVVHNKGELKPISPMYHYLWGGRGLKDLLDMWPAAFPHDPVPSYDEIREAVDAMSEQGQDGLEKSKRKPIKSERMNATKPLIVYRRMNNRLNYVPALQTIEFIKNLEGKMALPAESKDALKNYLHERAEEIRVHYANLTPKK